MTVSDARRNASRFMRWSGLLSMAGGMLAIVLTVPFAAAYFQAYPGYDVPPIWLTAFRSRFLSVLTFAAASDVYNVYGRIFNFTYLLILPGVLSLHSLHQKSCYRSEKLASGVLVMGLLLSFIGVAGDYWLDGLGFGVELLGLLVLLLGSVLAGAANVRAGHIPSWGAWLLVVAGLSGIPFAFLVLPHVPSGPTFLFACSWVVLGYLLWRRVT